MCSNKDKLSQNNCLVLLLFALADTDLNDADNIFSECASLLEYT